MKKNRLRIIFSILIITFMILSIRLFQLTIVKGNTYRNFSDNNRIKQINLDATRGKIYDHKGKEIATSKIVYDLNAYYDRYSNLDKERRNDILNEIIKILDEDGVDYVGSSAFSIYEFMYKNRDDYTKKDKLPNEIVIDKLNDKEILKKILLSKINNKEEAVSYYPAKRIINYLNTRGKNFPIEIIDSGNSLSMSFIQNENYKTLLNQEIIDGDTKAIDYLVDKIIEDKSTLNFLIQHPLSRKIVYENIKDKITEIELKEIIFNFDKNFLENKHSIKDVSKNISIDSNAKSDFLEIVKNKTIKNLLTNVYSKQGERVIPVSILINMMEKKGINTEGISYQFEENQKNVKIIYKEQKNQSKTALERLIELAETNNLLDEFILNEDIIYNAQKSIFDEGLYPRMYIDVWEYSDVQDKKDFLEKYDSKDVFGVFAESKKNYNIENEDLYLTYSKISINENLSKQGFLAYSPVTIAKNISEESLIKIEERIPKDSGFEVYEHSQRKYPNDNVAAHVVGYLGSISEDYEVEEYVQYKKYDVDDFVGKYGLEESFEDTLRGSKGHRLVYTDVFGSTTGVLEETKPIPGNNLYTTIDLDFQKEVERITYDLLKSLREGTPYKSYYGQYPLVHAPKAQVASVVVMDVKTGGILAMVSTPSFNPNLFVNGISNYDWNLLNKADPKDIYAPRPIMNNVIQSSFPPGSTFKPLVSLAALENGLDPNAIVDTTGQLKLGGTEFNEFIFSNYGSNWGSINLYQALEVSSNYYFYTLGLGYNPNNPNNNITKVGLEDIINMTNKLGFHKPTGIEINNPREASGAYPNLESKVELVKIGLTNFLENNLKDYLKKDVKITNDKLKKDIDTIVSWVNSDVQKPLEDIFSELEKMGYESEKQVGNYSDTLAEYIKYSYLNQAYWSESDSVNMVIGQGQNAYTPMQMVQYASILANRGKLVHPTLVSKITSYDDKNVIYKKQISEEEVDVNSKYFEDVAEGMRRASAGVNLRSNLPFEVGAKTGTAELHSIDPKTGEYYDYLVSEIAYAPFEKPEIAVYFSVIEGMRSENVRAANTDIIYAYYKYVKEDKKFNLER